MAEEHDKVASSPRYVPTEAFISEEDFQYLAEVKEAEREALGWSLLPQNIIYEISSLSTVVTRSGRKDLLELSTEDGKEIRVWCPSNIVRDIKSGYKQNAPNCRAYIKSLGEQWTNIEGEKPKKFFDFQAVYFRL